MRCAVLQHESCLVEQTGLGMISLSPMNPVQQTRLKRCAAERSREVPALQQGEHNEHRTGRT